MQQEEWKWTRYWIVTEGNPTQFVVVKDSSGKFVFDVLSENTRANVEAATFDLDEISTDYPGQWMGGFNNRANNVQNGTLYGNDIESDTDMGTPFVNSDKNQIGPVISYDSTRIQARIGREGFVQIVSPGNYGRENYLKFCKDILLNYTI